MKLMKSMLAAVASLASMADFSSDHVGSSMIGESRVSYRNNSVAYSPKRTKLKGWQKQARQHGGR